jgi:hypothetical protein
MPWMNRMPGLSRFSLALTATQSRSTEVILLPPAETDTIQLSRGVRCCTGALAQLQVDLLDPILRLCISPCSYLIWILYAWMEISSCMFSAFDRPVCRCHNVA